MSKSITLREFLVGGGEGHTKIGTNASCVYYGHRRDCTIVAIDGRTARVHVHSGPGLVGGVEDVTVSTVEVEVTVAANWEPKNVPNRVATAAGTISVG